jgi:hypothetical protein
MTMWMLECKRFLGKNRPLDERVTAGEEMNERSAGTTYVEYM